MTAFEILVKWLRVRNDFREYLFSVDCSKVLSDHDVSLSFDGNEQAWQDLFLVKDWN